MLVKFIPTGDIKDTNLWTFAVGPSNPARTPLILDSPANPVPLVGTRTSGTNLYITGAGANACIIWRTKNGSQVRWPMTSLANAETGRDALLAAFSNAPAADVAVSLTAAGVVAAM